MSAPSWIEHINVNSGSYGVRTSPLTADEEHFLVNRERAATIAEANDPDANYDYHDHALCELDGVFYVFSTSGCSCPSPSETWTLDFKGDREAALDYLVPGNAEYGLSAWHNFLRAVEAAGWALRSPVPEAGNGGYDF